MDDCDGELAAPPATPPPPAATQPSPNASPPADTPASDATPSKTPNFSDTPTPGPADPDTPFSDADASAAAPAFSDVAMDAAGYPEDDGVDPSGAGKRIALAPPAAQQPPSKKSKKKNSNSVWTRPTSRKGKKKAKQPAHPPAGGSNGSRRPKPSCAGEDEFFLTPAPRLAAERNDDAPDLPILLSRVFKSERIELSEDRLTAGSTKGFRMIRATRGVASGSWYFEVKVLHLGPSGHTRLGWATNSADLQTPVGCDGFGFGYRDIDGSKVHKAWRHEYASQGYGEGDVLAFYISLPDGEQYEPKQPDLVHYKGMPFRVEVPKDEQKMPDPVPGSEICYFKNGVCQGTAFTDIPGGRYYPAASMYTLPDQPNCKVRFNFGPDFEFFPSDLGGRPSPKPMSEVPYKAYELNNEIPTENGITEKAALQGI